MGAFARQLGPKAPVDLKAELVTYFASWGKPFSMVEDMPFVSLLKALRPDLSPVGRRSFSCEMEPLSEEVFKAIEKVLVEATGDKDFWRRDADLDFDERPGAPSVAVRDRSARVLFSITLDGWTNVAQKPYLGITMQFIDKSSRCASLRSPSTLFRIRTRASASWRPLTGHWRGWARRPST